MKEKEDAAEERSESKGSWKEELVSEPEGGQESERYAGFRERKDAMHRQDGKTK